MSLTSNFCFLWWECNLIHFLHYFICLVDCYLLWRLEVLLLLSLFHQHRLQTQLIMLTIMCPPENSVWIMLNWLQWNMASDWLILQFSFMESSTSLEVNTNFLWIFTLLIHMDQYTVECDKNELIMLLPFIFYIYFVHSSKMHIHDIFPNIYEFKMIMLLKSCNLSYGCLSCSLIITKNLSVREFWKKLCYLPKFLLLGPL